MLKLKRSYGKFLDHLEDTLKNANSNSRFFNQGEIDIEVVFSIFKFKDRPG